MGRRRWRGRLLALLVGWLVVEVLVVPLIAWVAPLAVRVRLPSPLYVIGQTSKANWVPEDYVLVVGDSYAEGHGDWLTEALEAGGNPAFQAGDVIHALTGRDVLSFGRGGADSVSSCVYLVQKRFAALRRLGLRDPDEVVVFFYEGNDLNENLTQARRRLGLGERAVESYDVEAELDDAIAARARKGFWSGVGGNFYAPYLLADLVQGNIGGGADGAGKRHLRELEAGSAQPAMPTRNVIAIGDRRFELQGPPQGPALELTEAEVDLCLGIFEHSLAWIRRRFEGTPMTVVYIPSPLSCYELVSSEFEIQSHADRPPVYPRALVAERSGELRARVAELVAGFGLPFVDATPALREAAGQKLIHGPRDGRHFNRDGYEILGSVIAAELGVNSEGR